ncbi:MAG: hypothetical protein MUE40_11800, partial [Anaerolineae bacterium]|nr:hypothetical protein [Anaerolineae bacterium]
MPSSTFTPSATFTPTVTLTATFDATRAAELLMTRAAERFLTEQAQLPTWTPPPTNPPTRTLAPTLDVTPTFITVTAAVTEIGLLATPVPSTPEPAPDAPTATAAELPTLAPLLPTPLPPEIVQQGFITPIPQPITFSYSPASVTSYVFEIAPGTAFTFNGATVTGGVRRYAANPAFPGSFVYTDLTGMVRYAPPGSPEGVLTDSPFFDGFSPGSEAENKNRVVDIGWAPNGQWFYFIVSPPPGTAFGDTIDAGLWFWQPGMTDFGRTFPLLHDCLAEWRSCELVQGRPANQWRTLKAEFSPDSTRVLATLALPEEGRQALAVVGAITDPFLANNAPAIVRYDSGYWTADGRIIVSGRSPATGNVVIAVTDSALNNEQVLFDAT